MTGIYILSSNMWFQKLMIQFFFNIDKIVYNFIPSVYDLLLTIARTSVLTQADIANMADRIYKLLAVFMIFKVSLSLITYVVNPDDFSDKSKGLSKLGSNCIITLALLILVPYIFSYAYQFQTIVVEDNALAALIFGDEQGDEENKFFNSAGDNMAYTTMSAFYSPNLSLKDVHKCSVLMTKSNTIDKYTFDSECKNALLELSKDNDNFDEKWLDNYVAGVQNNNFGLMFRQNMALATDTENENFIMNYKYIFSTVMGVIIILLLVTFCMDIAVRSIKLALLQLIAPIPIISYIDPKSGKDGLFKKWCDMCFKTYLSLFIRLLALYFAVYIIGKVASFKMVDLVDGSYQTNAFVAIFIIIGALMFAKQFPKILEGLGLKMDGGFTLNPLRKVEKEALGGGILKKPNDALSKLGKAALKSPISGLSTLGKKTIGGIDSKMNGGKFKTGFGNTHGKLHNNFYKKLDEWAPDSAEARKNRAQGRKNISKMEEREDYGKQLYDRAGGKTSNLPFSSEYRQSFDATERAKKEMYQKQAEKQAKIADIENRMKNGEYSMEEAQERIGKVNAETGKYEKRYEVAKARHDEMKKMHSNDAKMEDAFDYYDKIHTQPQMQQQPQPQQQSQTHQQATQSEVYSRVNDAVGITHMENRDKNDWEHDSAFATMSDSDFQDYQRQATEKNSNWKNGNN